MITIKQNPDFLEASIVPHSSLQLMSEFNQYIFKVLQLHVFDSKNVLLLVTLSPQNYSLGYEIGNPVIIEHSKTKYLINSMDSSDRGLIEKVAFSEEFERGLLRILINHSEKPSFDFLHNTLFQKIPCAQDAQTTVFEYSIISRENDGYTFYWCNQPKNIDFEALLK